MSLTAKSRRSESQDILQEIRMEEINKDLPGMHTMNLMEMKQEMLARINNFKFSDFTNDSPAEAREALRAVNAELAKRVEAKKVVTGRDDATLTMAHLAKAKAARAKQQEDYDAKKQQRIKDDFNQMDFNAQQFYLINNEDPNNG